ncbi:hypothetical protein [Arcobacter sp.]|uniref:hypothetical protein n=1 Tax=Arcobacter sp. TaxID=1872629 RepID=UPI003D0974FD
MKEIFYGQLKQVECNSDIDLYVEEIKIDRFTIIENVLTEEDNVICSYQSKQLFKTKDRINWFYL